VGQPALVQLNGAVTTTPTDGCAGSGPSLTGTMQLWVRAAYGASKSVPGAPVSATDISPQAIPLEGIAKVRFLVVKSVRNQPLKLFLTSPNGGANQQVPFSDLVVLSLPGNGDELTAISVSGVGDIQYVIAGDAG